ncbi:hypothetical protein OpiT1DRAFT_05638 [Opitutaceae bacterium TAV1]|nr:hypothetical protein OpiT1DRAFT_05638 [Opitutaceae bacterium TAV1]
MTIVKLDKAAVVSIFNHASSQQEYLEGLYRLVIPEWETVEQVTEYPVCSRDTWMEICKLARSFDENLNKSRTHNNNKIMPGGAWMNSGFGTANDGELALWEVRPPDPAKILRKQPVSV